MKVALFYLSLLFVSTSLYSQSLPDKKPTGLELIGKVNDAATHQPVPFATVALWKTLNGKDSLLTGVSANETGDFIFTNLAGGNLTLRISSVGYLQTEQAVSLTASLNLGNLTLKPDTKLLKEVTVTGQKDNASLSLEKRIFQVDKNLTTTGGTAENLLRNIPSLTIDADGSAKLRNVTTTIYINGKPTQLSLAQIPANQIESVELITNPSAKYDASASSGIVNLVLKKNREPGYNGTLSVGVGNNSRYDATLSLDYNRGKWNLNALYSLNATQNPLPNYAYRTNFSGNGTPLGYYSQNTLIALNNVFQNARVAADYNLDPRNTLTLAGTYIAGQYNSTTQQHYENFDASRSLASQGDRNTQPLNNYTNAGAEFDWKHSFSQKGRTLVLTTGYNRNQVSNAADWQTTFLNPDGTSQPGYPLLNHIAGTTTGNQVIAQLDYTKPVNDSAKWEMGLRSFTYLREQQYYFNQFNPASDNFELQSTYSQDARITETVNALYVLYTTKLRHNFSLQAGLRVEQSGLRGLSRLAPATTFGYDFPQADGKNFIKALFPSFALSKKLGEESEIGINLSRKIGRPGWRQIFIGIQSNDKQNISIGNPALQPEFVNTAEFNYNTTLKNVRWLSTLYYILEDNTIKPYVQPSTADPSVFVTTFTNVKADIRAGFDNTWTFSAGKNLSLLANFNLFDISLQTDSTKRTLWTYNAKLSVTYRFPANISAQLSGSNDSRFPQLQGYRGAVRAADFAVRKSFMQNRASVVFTVNDIFNSRKQYLIYDQPAAYQETMSRREVRYYKLTLQLPLGKAEGSKKKKDIRLARPDVDFGN